MIVFGTIAVAAFLIVAGAFLLGHDHGLDQFSTVVPNTVFKFLTALRAQGIDFKPLLGKLGVNLDELERLLTSQSAPVPVEVKPVAEIKSRVERTKSDSAGTAA